MPTIKQKRAFKAIVENRGNISKSMLEAGYSLNTAKNPKNLTESEAWQEMMEEYLPDKDLVKVHKEGLKATKVITSHTEPDREYPDYATRHRYLETAYKIKGRLEEWNSGDIIQPLSQNILILIDKVYGRENSENASDSQKSELPQKTG